LKRCCGLRNPRKESESIVDIFDSIIGALQKGERSRFADSGFRTGRRVDGAKPETGKVEVPAKKIPFFKLAGTEDFVNTANGESASVSAPSS